MLLARPLSALPAGERVVILVDALDEVRASSAVAPAGAVFFTALTFLSRLCNPQAEGENPLANAALRLLISLGAALGPSAGGPVLCVVTSTRPEPRHITQALRGRWGAGARLFSPGELRAASGPAAAGQIHASAGTRREEVEAPRFHTVEEALTARSSSKVFCTVLKELARVVRLPSAGAPWHHISNCAPWNVRVRMRVLT